MGLKQALKLNTYMEQHKIVNDKENQSASYSPGGHKLIPSCPET